MKIKIFNLFEKLIANANNTGEDNNSGISIFCVMLDETSYYTYKYNKVNRAKRTIIII